MHDVIILVFEFVQTLSVCGSHAITRILGIWGQDMKVHCNPSEPSIDVTAIRVQD